MKITSCGPSSPDKPYIPRFAVRTDGTHSGDRAPGDPEEVVVPFELADGAWFAVLEDGTVESFLRMHESEWAARNAMLLVQRSSSARGEPLKALSLLRAAAALVGLSLHDLIASVSLAREPGETLEAAFRKLRDRSSQGK